MAFDKNKPYGEVYGEGVKARYEQFGKLYDGDFNELKGDIGGPPATSEAQAPKVVVVNKAIKTPAQVAAEAQVAAQLAG